MRALMTVTFLLCLVGCPGEDVAAKRAQERLKKAEAEKAEKKKRSAELDAARQLARKGEPTLGAPWDDAKILVPDGPCPVGLWALFPDPAPGADKQEMQDNEAARADLLTGLKAESYMVKLRPPEDVVVGAADAVKGGVPLEVNGSMQCTDGHRRISIAWSPAKVQLVAPTGTTAAGLLARVVFRFGPAGENGDKPGAPRLLRAELVGVRVATDQEKTLVVEKKTAP